MLLREKCPDLLDEWDSTKNSLTSNLLKSCSNKKVWWICKQSHSWRARIADRVYYQQGCPYCSGRLATKENNLLVKYPELAISWHPTKNSGLRPESVKPKSHHKVWWICKEGHEWMALVSSRVGGRGCPYCAGKKASTNYNLLLISPFVASQWHPSRNGDLKPEQISPGSKRSIWFLCSKGHEWSSIVCNRTGTHNQGCPLCSTSYTRLERFIEDKLQIKRYNFCVLKNAYYRPDFKLNDNLYFNADGLYWHSELNKEREYHIKLRRAFESEGKRILQFYEDEIYNKWPIIENIINYSLNRITTKISARKCDFKMVSVIEADDFYKKNHLMGTYSIAKHASLIYNNEIVSLMSFRSLKDDQIFIERFCNKSNISVRGSFQKLLNYVIVACNPLKIISFCDLRYTTGKSYEQTGFKLIGVRLGYRWTDFKNTFHRLYCTASNGMTEIENAKARGLTKVYDAGQAKYTLDRTLKKNASNVENLKELSYVC